MIADNSDKPKRNHHIAVKTCRNFSYKHYPRLVHCCNEVMKQYRYMSIEIVVGKDKKANRWSFKYAKHAGKLIKNSNTPEQMINYCDALILFGNDPLLERLEQMAVRKNAKVYKFSLN